MIKIALLGIGTVGQGVYNILTKNNAFSDISIKYVLVNDLLKKRKISEKLLTIDYNQILNDDEIKVVIEVMGTYDVAYQYIKSALLKGKHVITANKEVISTYLEELTSLANENQVSLFFEASVGGGVPIIHNLLEMCKINKIIKIQGILNGTTNYILTKMQEKGMTFQDVLLEAQAKGFAEKDPKNDIEGFDIARKITILSQIAFKEKINLNDIDCYKINNVSDRFINYAYRCRYVLRYVATATPSFISVEPVLFSVDSMFANVDNEYNYIEVTGDVVGNLAFYGKGAGDYPTTHAITMDLLKIINGIKSPVIKSKNVFHKKDENRNYQYLISGKDLYITKPISRDELRKINYDFYARIEEE